MDEEGSWADAIDEEAFKAQKVWPLPEKSTAGWESLHCQDPHMGHMEEFLMLPEETAQVHQDVM